MDYLTTEPTGNREYDLLPECIKINYTLEQWLWLSDDEKGRLEQNETEPDEAP